VNLDELEEGPHTVDVRSFDGTQYSDIGSVIFMVDRPSKNVPAFGLAVALMVALLATVGILMLARKRRPID
jgi:hypothetical protein